MLGPVVTMPGKMGDLLMAVPAMRELRRMYGRPLTLVTSPYCLPAARVLQQRTGDLLAMVHVFSDYRARRQEPGLQPAVMPVPAESFRDGHRDVFHLGLRCYPLRDETIPECIGRTYHLTVRGGPWLDAARVDQAGPVVVHVPGDAAGLAAALVDRAGKRRVRLIVSDADTAVVDPCGIADDPRVDVVRVVDLDDVWQALDGASRFIGVASAPAVVAAASGVPCEWAMRPGVDERWIPRGCSIKVIAP